MHRCKLADVNITQWTSIGSVWLKGSLGSRADTCSEWSGWPVLRLQAPNCEEVQIGVDAGEDWLCGVGNLVLARICQVTGAWLLSFPGLLKHFQKKICSLLGGLFSLLVIMRMSADTYREVDQSETVSSSCKTEGSHLHNQNKAHFRLKYALILKISQQPSNITTIWPLLNVNYGGRIDCHNDETHPPVKLC